MVKALKVGQHVHVPDRKVNAWGRVLELQGSLVRVQLLAGMTTSTRIVWYRRHDLHTSSEWRKR